MVKDNKKDYTTPTKEHTNMVKNYKENYNGLNRMKNILMREVLMIMNNFKATVHIY